MKAFLILVLSILFLSIPMQGSAYDYSYTWEGMEVSTTIDVQDCDWLWWRAVNWQPFKGLMVPSWITECICTDEEDPERDVDVLWFHYDFCRVCDEYNDRIRTANPNKGAQSESSIGSRIESKVFDRLLVVRPVGKDCDAMKERADTMQGSYDWLSLSAYGFDANVPDVTNGFKINCLKKKIARTIFELAPVLTMNAWQCLSSTTYMVCGEEGRGCQNVENIYTYNPIGLLRAIENGTNTEFEIAGEYEFKDGEVIRVR